MIFRQLSLSLFVLCGACASVSGQETSSGISIPITISGEARQTNEIGDESSFDPGFRAVISPSLRLGPHWFVYAALDTHSASYFPYETGADDDRKIDVELMQAFVGYLKSSSRASILIKAGQISSAFGLFPLDYDDAKMALINPPLPYTANLPIRADQVPCGVPDIVWQTYDSGVTYHCGGASSERYGLTPVTLYGLPSIEAQISLFRFDGRLQITNSSPANPRGLLSASQEVQWTAGGGYSLPGGLHLGVSGFRGPYLDHNLSSSLTPSVDVDRLLATGIGVDGTWSHGPWSARGEWMHFRFALPGFEVSPTESAAYAEVKRIISPRVFAAVRINQEKFGRIKDDSGAVASHSTAPQQLYELTLGYRINRQQLLKFGGGWGHENAWTSQGALWPKGESYSWEIQLVTSFTALSKVL